MTDDIKKRTKNMADEFHYALKLSSRIEDEVERERIENAWFWYIRKARWVKYLFYLLSVLGIVSGAAVFVINSLPLESVLKGILTSIAAVLGSVSTAIYALFSLKETWRRNRSFAETIKTECFDYLSSSAEYFEKTKDEAKRLFNSNINDILLKEGKQWNDSKKVIKTQMNSNKTD